jgi:hypothetical protein
MLDDVLRTVPKFRRSKAGRSFQNQGMPPCLQPISTPDRPWRAVWQGHMKRRAMCMRNRLVKPSRKCAALDCIDLFTSETALNDAVQTGHGSLDPWLDCMRQEHATLRERAACSVAALGNMPLANCGFWFGLTGIDPASMAGLTAVPDPVRGGIEGPRALPEADVHVGEPSPLDVLQGPPPAQGLEAALTPDLSFQSPDSPHD